MTFSHSGLVFPACSVCSLRVWCHYIVLPDSYFVCYTHSCQLVVPTYSKETGKIRCKRLKRAATDFNATHGFIQTVLIRVHYTILLPHHHMLLALHKDVSGRECKAYDSQILTSFRLNDLIEGCKYKGRSEMIWTQRIFRNCITFRLNTK